MFEICSEFGRISKEGAIERVSLCALSVFAFQIHSVDFEHFLHFLL